MAPLVGRAWPTPIRATVDALVTVVETMGFEPTTPCLQSRCSSQLSYVPEVVGQRTGQVGAGANGGSAEVVGRRRDGDGHRR
jgi:hypothetical protein